MMHVAQAPQITCFTHTVTFCFILCSAVMGHHDLDPKEDDEAMGWKTSHCI